MSQGEVGKAAVRFAVKVASATQDWEATRILERLRHSTFASAGNLATFSIMSTAAHLCRWGFDFYPYREVQVSTMDGIWRVIGGGGD